jgi:hypothetical protein
MRFETLDYAYDPDNPLTGIDRRITDLSEHALRGAACLRSPTNWRTSAVRWMPWRAGSPPCSAGSSRIAAAAHPSADRVRPGGLDLPERTASLATDFGA